MAKDRPGLTKIIQLKVTFQQGAATRVATTSPAIVSTSWTVALASSANVWSWNELNGHDSRCKLDVGKNVGECVVVEEYIQQRPGSGPYILKTLTPSIVSTVTRSYTGSLIPIATITEPYTEGLPHITALRHWQTAVNRPQGGALSRTYALVFLLGLVVSVTFFILAGSRLVL